MEYGIKNHQVPNVECVRKNVSNIAFEPRGSEAANAANQNETQTQFQTKSTKFQFFQPEL